MSNEPSKERMPYLLSTYCIDDRVVIQCENVEKAEEAMSRVMAWLHSQVETGDDEVVARGGDRCYVRLDSGELAAGELVAVNTAAEVPQTSNQQIRWKAGLPYGPDGVLLNYDQIVECLRAVETAADPRPTCLHDPYHANNTLIVESHWGAGSRIRCIACGGCAAIGKQGAVVPETCECHSPPKTAAEAPQTSKERNPLAVNLEILGSLVRFAYQNGYHELGYDVLAETVEQLRGAGETPTEPDDAPDATAKFAKLISNAARFHEWDRMFDAWVKHQAGLPSDVALWPNADWSQEVAMIAHALAQQMKTS